MTPRRRRQPGSGATRAEPVFPTKREGPARRRRRHAVVAEALVPPGAGCSRRDSCRDSRRNSVHKRPKTAPRAILADLCTLLRPRVCPQQRNSVHKRPNPARRGPILPFVYTIAIPRLPTTQAHGATVYTNAPKRLRGAISSHLCTLLRRRPGGEAHIAGVVTQPPTHTNSRSLGKRQPLDLPDGNGLNVLCHDICLSGLTYDMAKAHFVAGKALKVGEVFDRIASYGRRCLHLHWMEGVAILDNEGDLMPFRIAVEPDVAQTPSSVHVAL